MTGQEHSLIGAWLAMLPFTLLLCGMAVFCPYLMVVKFKQRRTLRLFTFVIFAFVLVGLLFVQLETYRSFGGKRKVYDDNVAYVIVVAQLFVGGGLLLYAGSKFRGGT